MADPKRVGRWWTAVALATLWVLESGVVAQVLEIPATRVHVGPEQAAVTSLFALGRAVLAQQLARGSVRRLRRLPQPEWSTDTAGSDSLKEQEWLAEHQTVPL